MQNIFSSSHKIKLARGTKHIDLISFNETEKKVLTFWQTIIISFFAKLNIFACGFIFARSFLVFSLKLECEKLAQEKTEIQRQYIMVSFKVCLIIIKYFLLKALYRNH